MAIQNGNHRAQAARRILFLDAYDSFTSNIVSLLRQALGENVHVYVRHMDLKPLPSDADRSIWTTEQLIKKLEFFDAVVCGPGPGSPTDPDDVGAFETIWERNIPVLGVCLGFQSLVCHAGGSIRKLRRGLHGMVRDIDFGDDDIFAGVRPFKATLYHSLCADIGQDFIPAPEWPSSRYHPTAQCPDLLPLAWTEGRTAEGEDERILMAVRHARKPFWGLQYHLESVCTDPAAHDVLRNWWAEVQLWNKRMGRTVTAYPAGGEEFCFEDEARVSHADRFEQLSMLYGEGNDSSVFEAIEPCRHYAFKRFNIPGSVSAAEVAEALGLGSGDSIILDSSSYTKGDPLAKFSIIALDVDSAPRLSHIAGDKHVTLSVPTAGGGSEEERIGWQCATDDEFSPWQAVSKFWLDRHTRLGLLRPDEPHAAFKGGFMGFVTYESGLSTLSPGTVPRRRAHERPDICLAWVTRSVVLDHVNGVAYVQALSSEAEAGQRWCFDVAERLQTSLPQGSTLNGSHKERDAMRQDKPTKAPYQYSLPGGDKYRSKVRQCQSTISEGNSYELCLTAQTIITRPRPSHQPTTPWDMFKTLRSRQPAPFGSFIRLGGATLVSSSPERFLRHTLDGVCSMRPMKGTVRRSEEVSTLAQAEDILHIPKEEAENLMIVDLVRHDLHGICGSGRVTVPELLKVEEYATVFQMVTNVQGQLPRKAGAGTSPNGLDVLSSVLPPGSMTGAPKKRSCEILHELEGGIERSLYSGVVGYMDVTGRGDWSVTIRSTFKWDDETTTNSEGEALEKWHIGAGGAVTILSTPEGEYDEMRTKLQGPLSIFEEMERR